MNNSIKRREKIVSYIQEKHKTWESLGELFKEIEKLELYNNGSAHNHYNIFTQDIDILAKSGVITKTKQKNKCIVSLKDSIEEKHNKYDIRKELNKIHNNQELMKQMMMKILIGIGDSKEEFMPSEKDEELLTVPEAAKMLSVTKWHIYRLCKENKIPYSKPNGKIYIYKGDIKQWLDNNKNNRA